MILTTMDLETGIIYGEEHVSIWDKERERKQKYIDKKNDTVELRKTFNSEEYGFYNHCFFNKISYQEKQYITRFMYLGSYSDYEGYMVKDINNKKKREYIKINETMGLLNLSQREFMNTKQYLIDNDFIEVDKDNKIIINKKYINKGEVKMSNKEFQKVENDYVRVFDNTVKTIYENSTPKEHKRLGLLFQILPYLNVEHNVLCTLDTVNEKDETKIKAITMKELCLLIGYDVTKSTRLKRELLNITIGEELVIGVFETKNGKAIIVNARLFYKGSDLDNLNGIRAFFKIKNNVRSNG